MLNQDLLAILACPQCKGAVTEKNGGLVCEKCRLFYEIKDDIPIMLVENAIPLASKDNHAENDYFAILHEIIEKEKGVDKKIHLDAIYEKIRDEIITNTSIPVRPIKFGTSGWRGILGKDITVKTITQVTRAIVQLYQELDTDSANATMLGVESLAEAQKRGCVIGCDNRFAGELLAIQAARVLVEAGFIVHYAGETTTGVLSAVIQQKDLAFSINLTPSHNPLEYGGYKFNGGDAGPAPSEITSRITQYACTIVAEGEQEPVPDLWDIDTLLSQKNVFSIDSFSCWQKQIQEGEKQHGISYAKTIKAGRENSDILIAIDSMHGASRLHISRLLGRDKGEGAENDSSNFVHLRNNADVTFGGIAPEPSTANIQGLTDLLQNRVEKFKLGAIIDPDGDRIRFTDGSNEISMNQFGAMVYHFLHEYKGKTGMVAKTVATSNLANSLSKSFGEKIFEPAVGFKNFKPVIGKALVFFEESDGISTIGHTAEKDAYIGLIIAMSIIIETGINLGEYLQKIEQEYGVYIAARDGIIVSFQGKELQEKLSQLEKFGIGVKVKVGDKEKSIAEVITIDGRKMIFDDGSWLMIRPSGTEPKVRFYVESRTVEGTKDLVATAKEMLTKIGVI